MPAPEIARAMNDIDHEVRVIRALYPQQCLGQRIQSLSPALIPGSQTSPCIYHNTGVQLLPPPNGHIFKLSHGREPSEVDYVRNVGAAAIGRFANDPRSNPCELIYGTAYPAPPTAQGRFYVETGFQTASYDSTTLALAKAKAKASVMASRYREAAIQAGYAVFAEPKDEMIVHSEQFRMSVQLDAKGNLLKGTVEGLYLPNICGTSLRPLFSTSHEETAVIDRNLSSSEDGRSQIALIGAAPCSSPPQMSVSIPQGVEIGPPATIATLAPSSVEHLTGPKPIFDDEYGNVGSCIRKYVVYDVRDSPRSPTLAAATKSVSSPRRQELDQKHHSDTTSQKSKTSSSVTPRRFFIPATFSPKPPTQCPNQPPRSQPSVAGHERTLPAKQSNATDIMEPNMFCSTGLSASAFHRKMPASSTNISKQEMSPRPRRLRDSRGCFLRRDIGYPQPGAPSLAVGKSGSSAPESPPNSKASSSSQGFMQERYTDVDAKLAIRRRASSQSQNHDGDSGPETKRRKRSSKFRRKRKDVDTFNHDLDIPESKSNASTYRTTTSQHGAQQPAPSVTAEDYSTKLSRVEKKSTSRVTRNPRRPFTPYVPPAMRAKAPQARNDDKVGKGPFRK